VILYLRLRMTPAMKCVLGVPHGLCVSSPELPDATLCDIFGPTVIMTDTCRRTVGAQPNEQ
jgi:hypothetical protein